jgi:hypothetical protein
LSLDYVGIERKARVMDWQQHSTQTGIGNKNIIIRRARILEARDNPVSLRTHALSA